MYVLFLVMPDANPSSKGEYFISICREDFLKEQSCQIRLAFYFRSLSAIFKVVQSSKPLNTELYVI